MGRSAEEDVDDFWSGGGIAVRDVEVWNGGAGAFLKSVEITLT